MRDKIGTIICLVVAISFIAIGIILNQQTDVFNKAVKICLECVGIG